MDEDDPVVWPADEDDASTVVDDDQGETGSTEESDAVEEAPSPDVESDVQNGVMALSDTSESSDEPTPWSFPIRAAPILALQGEEVVEFPLSQHRSGLESTSLIMDDELMRIVESRYDPDGIRRLNVRMALVKKHISGYSHTHLDLFQKLQGVWLGAIGFGLLMATSFAQGLLALGGGAFVLTGVAGLLLSQLDLHRISFSDHGGRHDFYLSGWRQEPYLIHNSTALLGPAFVEFLRTETLDTQHIDAVVEAMAAPPQPAPQPVPAPMPAPDTATPLPLPPPAESIPEASAEGSGAVAVLPTPPVALKGPPVSVGNPPPSPPLPPPPVGNPQTSNPLPPTPPAPISAPIPLPPAPLPPAQLPPAPLPMAPLPPPPSKAQMDEDALWDDLN